MNILMLAPEPFFESRGTPFSVYYRCKALGDLGHQVDLLCYHVGKDVSLKNVKIHRIPKIPFVKKVKTGPQYFKIFLDFFILTKALRMCMRKHYDVVHTHEEACLFGHWLKKIFGMKHIYDMHSSIPNQLRHYQTKSLKPLIIPFDLMERMVIKGADETVVICEELGKIAERFSKNVHCIHNLPLNEMYDKKYEKIVKEKFKDSRKKLVYTGSLGPQQEIELLIDAMEQIKDEKIVLLLVGTGKREYLDKIKGMIQKKGLEKNIILCGHWPVEAMGAFEKLADVLVSPRKAGINTPLKIYSYIAALKPIVATDLPTHTQVLTHTDSILTVATADAFAKGILKALKPNKTLIENMKKDIKTKYNYQVYKKKIEQLYS